MLLASRRHRNEGMPEAIVDGVSLAYEVHGDGPPLVLSHCLGGSRALWTQQIPALAAAHRLVLWDCRGHGESGAPAMRSAYAVMRFADDLAGLLDHLGIEKAHIGGLSMGGGISAGFAIAYPERVDRLIICDSNTAAALPVPATVRAEREIWIELCLAGDIDQAVDRFLANNPAYRLFAADSPQMRTRVRDMVLGTDATGFGHSIRALLDSDLPVERVANITAPTLVLAGANDPAMAAIRVTHERIAGSKLVTLADAGHLANLDQPRRFESAVLEFLAST